MSDKKFVSSLREKDHFTSVFVALEKAVGVDRNSKAYMSLQLSDASGSINARVFEKVEELSSGFQTGDFVRVKGFVQNFMGRLQVIAQEIRVAAPGEFQIGELVKTAAGDLDVLIASLKERIQAVRNRHIRSLLESVVDDPNVYGQMVKAPAAKTIHHAYIGGLLEHTVSILGVMKFMAEHYKFLDPDYLIFGAIFHDIGKVEELSIEAGIQYTDRGRLVGHMAIACEMIDKYSSRIEGFTQDLKDILKHIVLSHHGKIEYGSPKLPMTPEALVVAMIDDLDSKMNTLHGFLTSEASQLGAHERWTKFHPGFERYFLLDTFRAQDR